MFFRYFLSTFLVSLGALSVAHTSPQSPSGAPESCGEVLSTVDRKKADALRYFREEYKSAQSWSDFRVVANGVWRLDEDVRLRFVTEIVHGEVIQGSSNRRPPDRMPELNRFLTLFLDDSSNAIRAIAFSHLIEQFQYRLIEYEVQLDGPFSLGGHPPLVHMVGIEANSRDVRFFQSSEREQKLIYFEVLPKDRELGRPIQGSEFQPRPWNREQVLDEIWGKYLAIPSGVLVEAWAVSVLAVLGMQSEEFESKIESIFQRVVYSPEPLINRELKLDEEKKQNSKVRDQVAYQLVKAILMSGNRDRIQSVTSDFQMRGFGISDPMLISERMAHEIESMIQDYSF